MWPVIFNQREFYCAARICRPALYCFKAGGMPLVLFLNATAEIGLPNIIRIIILESPCSSEWKPYACRVSWVQLKRDLANVSLRNCTSSERECAADSRQLNFKPKRSYPTHGVAAAGLHRYHVQQISAQKERLARCGRQACRRMLLLLPLMMMMNKCAGSVRQK